VLDPRGQLLRAAQVVKTAWSESNARKFTALDGYLLTVA
jgi:hypothetical protein